MINTSKLALIAAIAIMGIASPALAQSFDPEIGTGNVAANVTASAPQQSYSSGHRSGLNAYAMVPATSAPAAATDPATTGGGSIGYNEMLRNY